MFSWWLGCGPDRDDGASSRYGGRQIAENFRTFRLKSVHFDRLKTTFSILIVCMLLRICCNTPPWESHYFLICFVQLPKVALATTGVRSPKLSVASPKHTHPSKNVTFSEIVAMRKSNECVKRAVWYVRELLARAATETDAG